jgi:hypothetical protein
VIVEPDAAVRALVAQVLVRYAYRVVVASGLLRLAEVVEAMESDGPLVVLTGDVALADWLARLSGTVPEARFRLLRMDGAGEHARTGAPAGGRSAPWAERRWRGIRVPKPFDIEGLLHTVARVLEADDDSAGPPGEAASAQRFAREAVLRGGTRADDARATGGE